MVSRPKRRWATLGGTGTSTEATDFGPVIAAIWLNAAHERGVCHVPGGPARWRVAQCQLRRLRERSSRAASTGPTPRARVSERPVARPGVTRWCGSDQITRLRDRSTSQGEQRVTSIATGRKVAPGHAAIEVLKANQVEVVFGLNGDHVLRLYDGLADLGGITHVTVKHENNAALAAEAYGRLTGRPGVAVTTAGPGALNSISGVASAMASGAPLVSLTGAVPSNAALETFHGVDDLQFTEHAFAPVTKSSRRVTSAGHIQAAITDAFELAVAGRPGPVHVEITRDVLEGDRFESLSPAPAHLPGGDVAPDLDQALARIRSAQHPIIVAGKGAWYAVASQALVALAEALEAPVCHTWEGHGAMPTVHPLSLGAYRIMETHPAVLRELSSADLIVGVGVRVGTEPFQALQQEYGGERLLILDAADVPDGRYGPRIGSVPSLAASLRALAASVRPSPSARLARATCAEAQRLLARGLQVELQRYSGTRPWHIGLAIADRKSVV